MWPELDAILVVPNNAHALFARPLVVSPESVVDVYTKTPAQMVADGFRILQIPPEGRVSIVRGAQPVRWVKLDDATFTDRLVSKFKLPVAGWRSTAEPKTQR